MNVQSGRAVACFLRSVAVLMTAALCGSCAVRSLPADTVSNLYEVEHSARQMRPQNEAALLYVLPSQLQRGGLRFKLHIDGMLALSTIDTKNEFYVFCLQPGKYELAYEAEILVPDRREFLEVKAGSVYVRSFSQAVAGIAFIPLTGSRIADVELENAKRQIASMRIGTDREYADSTFRCRSIG